MPIVKVLLTFDDGPHGAPLNMNHTVQVATQLNGLGIVAAFFVQTGVPYRMGGNDGKIAVKAVNGPTGSEMHVVEIHTGSREDHIQHWKRLKIGKLESDLSAAKNAIQLACGRIPKSVRAVGVELFNPDNHDTAYQTQTAAAILQIYSDLALRHIGMNVNSYDNTKDKWKGAKFKRRPIATEVIGLLRKGVVYALRNGPPELIVLFHELNNTTRTNLTSYITAIQDGVNDWNSTYSTSFTSTRSEVENLLANTNIQTNTSMKPDEFLKA